MALDHVASDRKMLFETKKRVDRRRRKRRMSSEAAKTAMRANFAGSILA
jgi:hypothetical protein